ncbi:MAG: hypothetical protein H0Z19_11470 [Archaeoglobus sp.]|uniref:hypothetical protein n=1 Tax=Archaeoglobus sp. TaxID=1872626 RepID=UPI001D28701F|nr:hypothetical protein [Archaeoglobus sp.]MBO8180844.1 hypothetical protein [Archaeoglobus sp.]MBO8181067.1 hypothetical protein [Archaeoglobus sp.]
MEVLEYRPVFSKRNGKEIIEVCKEPLKINKKKGVIVSGDFIFYVQNGEHYARIEIDSEHVLLLAKRISLAVEAIFLTPFKEETKVFDYMLDDHHFEVTAGHDGFKFYIYHNDEHYAAATISIADANYLAEVLRYDVLLEHGQMTTIQQAIVADIKAKLSGKKPAHNYDREAMLYG